MGEQGDIQVRSFQVTVAPDAVADVLETVAEAVGSHQRDAYVGEGRHRSRFRFDRDGRQVELFVDAADDGAVRLAFPMSVNLDDVTAVVDAIKRTRPKAYLGRALLSLGFRRLVAPMHVGPALVAAVRVGRVHGMRTGWHESSAGEVFDHVLVFPVSAVGWSSSNRAAQVAARTVIPVLAFMLDVPIAAYGEASAMDANPEGVSGPAEAERVLAALGCAMDRFDSAGGPVDDEGPVQARVDASHLYALLSNLSPADQDRVGEALRSYNHAMLLAQPEPGFERYEDKSTAVTLWNAIFEGLADGDTNSGKCAECGKPKQSINAKLKAFLGRLTEGEARPMSWPEFERLRRVRHKVAHEALRPLPGLQDLDTFPVFQEANVSLSVFGPLDMKALARKAILDFIRRGQPSASEDPEVNDGSSR